MEEQKCKNEKGNNIVHKHKAKREVGKRQFGNKEE